MQPSMSPTKMNNYRQFIVNNHIRRAIDWHLQKQIDNKRVNRLISLQARNSQMLDLTPGELKSAIESVRNRFPNNYLKIVDLVYKTLVGDKQQQNSRQNYSERGDVNKKEEELSRYDRTVRGESDSEDERPMPAQSEHSEEEEGKIVPPPFQRHEKMQRELTKPTPTKYEVQEDFTRMVQMKQLALSTEVYNRFGGPIRKLRPSMTRVDRNYQEDIQIIIRKAQEWKREDNKEYRIYASKIAPRFHSRDEEVRYYQKRLAAKAFCERGYGLSRVQEEYSQNGGPVNMEKRRYKTVSTAFISESYRRFQQFLNQDMRKNIRPLTGPEMRALYSVFLNASTCFQPVEYHCFRKCVKIAFDLGSVSIYEHDAISLFIAVQAHLKNRYPSGDGRSQVGSEVAPVRNRNHPLDIYAPVLGGGYEEKADDMVYYSKYEDGLTITEEDLLVEQLQQQQYSRLDQIDL